jgi:hypothetical protein
MNFNEVEFSRKYGVKLLPEAIQKLKTCKSEKEFLEDYLSKVNFTAAI